MKRAQQNRRGNEEPALAVREIILECMHAGIYPHPPYPVNPIQLAETVSL